MLQVADSTPSLIVSLLPAPLGLHLHHKHSLIALTAGAVPCCSGKVGTAAGEATAVVMMLIVWVQQQGQGGCGVGTWFHRE